MWFIRLGLDMPRIGKPKTPLKRPNKLFSTSKHYWASLQDH